LPLHEPLVGARGLLRRRLARGAGLRRRQAGHLHRRRQARQARLGVRHRPRPHRHAALPDPRHSSLLVPRRALPRPVPRRLRRPRLAAPLRLLLQVPRL
ncbi:hypothetical protein BN1708_020188, partial [Verticillium longisporum]